MRRNQQQIEILQTEPVEVLDTNMDLRLETQMSTSDSAGTGRAGILLERRDRVELRVKKSTKGFFKTMLFNFSLVIYLKLCSYLMLLRPFKFSYCVLGLVIIELISIVISFQGVKRKNEVTSKKTLIRAMVKDVAFMDIFSRLLCYLMYFFYGFLVDVSFTYSGIPFYLNSIFQIIRIFLKDNKVIFFLRIRLKVKHLPQFL